MTKTKNLKRQQIQRAAAARKAKRHKINDEEGQQKKPATVKKPTGRRIFSILAMEQALNLSAEHGSQCAGANLQIHKEIRDGLFTSFRVLFTHCSAVFNIKNDCDDCSLSANEAGVWAANSAGTGFSVIEHSMTVMEIPFMSKRKFIDRERKFHEELKTAVLIGVLTRKVLFISTRNKSCYVCQTYGEKHSHQCFKNWSGTYSGMEPSMIREGFEKSVKMHNMRYKRYIGDGDSSVFNEIQAVYCNKENNFATVEKIECKNHAIRCMNKNLRQLMGQKVYLIDHRKLFTEIVDRIGKACVYALAHHSDNISKSGINSLRFDMENVLDHLIGDHKNCKQHFCRNGILQVPKQYMKQTETLNNNNIEKEKTSDKKYLVLKNSPLYNECRRIINKVSKNCNSLILGRTTNLSENYFSQFAKFLQGKRVNPLQAGSYERKSLQTFLANMYGVGWYGPTMEIIKGSPPSSIIQNIYLRGLREREQNRTYAKNNKKRISRGKPFTNSTAIPKYFSNIRIYSEDNDYGPNALKPDISSNNLNEEIERYINAKKIQNASEQWQVHLDTVKQYDNEKYIARKASMVTASIAGKLAGLRDTTPNVKWLDRIIHNYPKFHGNADTIWGTRKEPVAIRKYEQMYNCEVQKAGLFVSLENPLLGASPDGLVGKDGIVEVKCPSKEKYLLPINVSDRKQNSYLKRDKSGKISLKQNHEYYSQVIMQLNVTNRIWCDFIVWTQGPLNEQGQPLAPDGHILIDRIYKNQTFVAWKILNSKLDRFVKEDLLPELVDSRLERNMGYRQPSYRADKIRERDAKKKVRVNSGTS